MYRKFNKKKNKTNIYCYNIINIYIYLFVIYIFNYINISTIQFWSYKYRNNYSRSSYHVRPWPMLVHMHARMHYASYNDSRNEACLVLSKCTYVSTQVVSPDTVAENLIRDGHNLSTIPFTEIIR